MRMVSLEGPGGRSLWFVFYLIGDRLKLYYFMQGCSEEFLGANFNLISIKVYLNALQ